jgi:hypothetical protein
VLNHNWPVLRMYLPEWSAALIVGVSMALALVVLVAMLLPFGRGRGPQARATDADAPAEQTFARPGLDVMLLISTLTVAGLALAVYLTRP